MMEYWSTDEAKKRSRIASGNRLSDRDGFEPHRHISCARSYEQLRNLIEGVELYVLCILRETHRKADVTYVNEKAKSIDEEIQRQLDEIEISRSSDGASLDGTNAIGFTRLDEDELFYKVVTPQNGRIFGVGGINTRERGESSTTGVLGRITLERQVITLQEQLASVVEYMKQYMPNDRANNMETGDAAHDQDGAEIHSPNPHVDDEDVVHNLDGEEYEGGDGF
ncbi:putative transposase Ptta/En/Spm plant [Arabidopsis thaliana x Arabidopsis arenosa]|uniref:Putative transposase Ptta/En/Spm plant n=1 Tax=Arabidopsis thaliana x Arabidopsis arenosa TaxID=1240361 RepID=A0A8T1ZLI5_9BRAS|nr:putative transposase Ptta/En/Spm plant [Arabidopsis thaliana x Arabidopsis arenosa]